MTNSEGIANCELRIANWGERHSAIRNSQFAIRILPAILLCLLAAVPAFAQSPQAVVDRVFNDPKVKAAQQFLDADHERFVREIIYLTEIPAPPFKESQRAQAFMRMLREHGLSNVEIDAEGNALGLRKGTGAGPLIAIAAHLDTVFPEDADVKVRRQGTRLMAPGVGDNSRGLAVLLAIIRALDHAQIQTSSDILFVGNVGEEGPGDLRGMRHLFQKGPYKDKIKMFVAIDGAGAGRDIVTGALGSKRYRVVFRGPGGHSYGAFGIVNPAYAMAKAIDKISRIQTPAYPRTTFNVGMIGGGTSVNSIPHEVWMEVDLRSEGPAELDRLADNFVRQVRAAVDEENAARSIGQGRIEADIQAIGDRPSGATRLDSPIVQAAGAVVRKFGMEPQYSIGSTDSNIPISMNIPAITIDTGGYGGRAHSLDEWIDVERSASVRGIHLVMVTLLSLAELRAPDGR